MNEQHVAPGSWQRGSLFS